MISAYMIIHNDDDFLEDALDSVNGYVDEIIIVDGAYEWVAPFFEEMNVSADKSRQKTHDILAKYGEKIKYFSGTWRDELHKRDFGYSQCFGDIILRVDADEIFQINDDVLADFLISDKAVAQMEFPLLLTPNKHRQTIGETTIPCQCFLFKRAKINAEEHCGYLWLVLTEEEENRRGKPDWEKNLFHNPVARVAHMTELRTPDVSVNRARFYSLLYTRKTGIIPWEHNAVVGEFDPNKRVREMLGFMKSEQYTTYLQGIDIVAGYPSMEGFFLDDVTFRPGIYEKVEDNYKKFLDGVDARKVIGEFPRTLVDGMQTGLNITRILEEKAKIIKLSIDGNVNVLKVSLRLLLSYDGMENPERQIDINAEVVGDTFKIDLSNIEDQFYQAVLYITPFFAGGERFGTLSNVMASKI